MAKTRECCGALSLRRTGDDLHVSLHKGFKIRLAGIVPVFIEFTVCELVCVAGFLGFGGGEGRGDWEREGKKASHNPIQCCIPTEQKLGKLSHWLKPLPRLV